MRMTLTAEYTGPGFSFSSMMTETRGRQLPPPPLTPSSSYLSCLLLRHCACRLLCLQCCLLHHQLLRPQPPCRGPCLLRLALCQRLGLLGLCQPGGRICLGLQARGAGRWGTAWWEG